MKNQHSVIPLLKEFQRDQLMVMDREAWHAAVCQGRKELDTTE